MKDNFELQIDGNISELKILTFFYILFVVLLVFMAWHLSWHIVAVVGYTVCFIFILILWLIDWTYFGRTVILNADGCTFVSSSKTKTYSWDSIYLFHTMNSTSFYFGDYEIPGEGVILSVNPVKMPSRMRAMNYCKFTHPSTSVFIRFENPELERIYKKSAQIYLTGFVAAKEDVLRCLQYKQ